MIICFDFDDTLFTENPDGSIGQPIFEMIDLLKRLEDEGEIVTIFSGRPTEEIEQKVKELEMIVYQINDKKLKDFEGWKTATGKPYWDLYIDNKGVNSKEGADVIYDMVQSLKETEEMVQGLR